MSPFAVALAGGRIAIGAATWISPTRSAKAFGLDPDPKLGYIARLFGARDVALGVGVLTTSDEARRSWLQLGLACDALDTVAAMLAERDGSMRPRAAALAGGAAVAGAILGVLALEQES